MSILFDIKKWIQACRPRTLIASASPVLVTTMLVRNEPQFSFLVSLIVLIDAILLQIAANLANDVIDYERGSDTKDRIGPIRFTSSGLIAPEQMKLVACLALVLAFLLGIPLVIRGGLPIVIIGISAIITSVAYSGGPFPLSYRGLGEVATIVFFGFLSSWGTAYVSAYKVTPLVLIFGFCSGLFATAILTVNNIRDEKEDRLSGKRTLIVRFGRYFGLVEYSICLLCPFVFLIILSYFNILPKIFLGLVLFLPPVMWLIKTLFYTIVANDSSLSISIFWQSMLSRTGLVFAAYTIFVLFSVYYSL